MHNFSVDENSIGVDIILDNHKDSMKKTQYKIIFKLNEKVFIALLSFSKLLANRANAPTSQHVYL